MTDGSRESALGRKSRLTGLILVSCPAGPHPLSNNESLPSPPPPPPPLHLTDHKDLILLLPVAVLEHPPDSLLLHPSEMAVVMWNSGGLRAAAGSTDHKMAFFDKEFPQADFAIVAFLETHHKNEDDFPDLITHHCVQTSTPPDHTHSGIIVLVHRQYEILHTDIPIPGRMLTVRLVHRATQHAYNLTVYYARQVKQLPKAQMVDIATRFSQVHDVSHNNIIIGDINFADKDIDKGHGMSHRDHMMTSTWKEFTSAVAMVDPFRVHHPKRRVYSFVHGTGKSRGDRVIYVNEETVPHVSNHKYSITPFPLTHKILSFVIHDQQTRGRGYWKLNSSVLNDNAYVAMVRQIIENVDRFNIEDTQQWWDIFLSSVRSKTVEYTKQKHTVENSARDDVRKGLLDIEAIPADQLSPRQTAHYTYLKEKLRRFEEIGRGLSPAHSGAPQVRTTRTRHRILRETAATKHQQHRYWELRHKDGEVYSDNPTLLNIVTDFYTDLYTQSPVDVSVQ